MDAMSPDELKTRARRIAQELLTQGDLGITAEIFAPGCSHRGPHVGAPGTAAALRWVATLRRAFPDLRAAVEDEIAEGDAVAQRLFVSGTHRGAFLGIPPSGRLVSWPLAVFLRAGPEGAFTEHWSIWDRLDLLNRLGAEPAGGAPESRRHDEVTKENPT